MKFVKQFNDKHESFEVTYEEALNTLLSTYKDNEITRSMLTIGNYIPCRCSSIRVYDEDGLTAAPGLQNLVPDEVWDRIEGDLL